MILPELPRRRTAHPARPLGNGRRIEPHFRVRQIFNVTIEKPDIDRAVRAIGTVYRRGRIRNLVSWAPSEAGGVPVNTEQRSIGDKVAGACLRSHARTLVGGADRVGEAEAVPSIMR